ncbi:MAG: hypothetical protein KDJ29_11005 [Hyphomicrobiales bacterium]|nr:hypothetical protein [Hyphomicrobiales bacterium]
MVARMTALRPFVAALLALTLVTTSATVGVARGQTRASGTLIICAGQGVISIEVDAQGNPVGPVHICPDCVLAFMAATAGPAAIPARASGWHLADWPTTARAAQIPAPVGTPIARGPPRFA